MFKKNINIDQNILSKTKVPLLYNDANWLELFGQVEDKEIKKVKKIVEEKVSRQKQVMTSIKQLQSEKIQCMKMILGVSDSVNNSNKRENIRLLDEYKDKIESINEEIDDLTFESETIPKEIRKLNLDLLTATIHYGYNELIEKEDTLKQVTDEIDVLRNRLKELIKIKYDYEDRVNKTYTFFHSLLGSEVIEKIDKERLK